MYISLSIRLSKLLLSRKQLDHKKPLTSILESDKEATIVNETMEVRNLIVEGTADEPAMALEPGGPGLGD
ncbi:hypothetical protein Patl1_35781 [Pistacia atlantica]|nr:hypothetical protein Patl1_35781 [Pistacia atlantica]